MRSFLTKLIFLGAILSLTTVANAGFHMEPYLGYALSGDAEDSNSSSDFTTTTFGIKLGYQADMGLQVGGDIHSGTTGWNSANSDVNGVLSSYGAYVGYQSPLGFRGYFSYLFSVSNTTDQAFPFADITYKGNGMKFGAGYSVLHWLAINVEYLLLTYTEAESGGTPLTLSGGDIKNNAFLLTVSFPFNFGGPKR